MIYSDLTNKALALMCRAHEGQRDKGGMPYLLHPFHVAEQMTDEYSTAAALLHDVCEDSAYMIRDIRQMGFPEEICSALELLKHEPDVPYEEYIRKLKKNPIAVRVKLADLAHNMQTGRLKMVCESDQLRMEKYRKAMELLQPDRKN